MWMFPASLLLLSTVFPSTFNPKQWFAFSYASIRMLHMVHIFFSYTGEETQGLKITSNSVIQKGYFLPLKEKKKTTKHRRKEGSLLPKPDSPYLFQAAGWESRPLHPDGNCEQVSRSGAKGMGKEKLSSWLQRLLIKKLNRKQIKRNRKRKPWVKFQMTGLSAQIL